MTSRAACGDGSCVLSRSGSFCLICGRTFREETVSEELIEQALATPRDVDPSLDPNDPNYWVYLMHDIEIIAEPIAPAANAGIAFYGKRPNRPAR